MMFSVPQYIDIEDKIVGPLTWKQFLWLLGGAVILMVLWNMVGDLIIFLIIGVPILILFLGLAFYKPYDYYPLINFIFFAIMFVFSPKVYVWKRVPDKVKKVKKKPFKYVFDEKGKKVKAADLTKLARLIDSEGAKRDKEFIKSLDKLGH